MNTVMLVVNIICAVAVLALSAATVQCDYPPGKSIVRVLNYIFVAVLILFGVDNIAAGNKYALTVLVVYLVARIFRNYLDSIFDSKR